jgi:Fe-S-cluster-containing dehydrogenase component
MKRRSFLATLAAAGAAVTSVSAKGSASSELKVNEDSLGILIDLTACEGCRACEFVCADANGLPEPEDVDLEGGVVRKADPKRYVTVSSYETVVGEVYVRRQCMHCLEPACAAACLTKALERKKSGPVVWNEDKCMGCRYCMISCPFDVPQFEFDSPVPKIQKCKMCYERLAEGQVPACVEECPAEALTFGKRSELLEIARKRIYTNPGRYVSQIYGEHEAGGTGVLYLSPVPFAELGFRTDLGETAYPEYTRDFLTAVPVVLFLWPAFLLGLRKSRVEEVAHTADSDGMGGGAS